MSVLMAVAVSDFPKVKMNASLLRQANKFGQDLRIAQEMALAGVPYKDASGVERSVDGYGIYTDIGSLGNKKYIIYADKNPGNKTYDASDYIISTVDFGSTDPGIKIKEINNVSSNKASVNFNASKIETTITQLSSGQNNVEFVFSLESDPTKVKKVLVNNAGLVEIK